MPKISENDKILLHAVAENQRIKHINHYFTLAQKKEVIELMGYATFIVLDHYYWKVGAKSFNFADEKVAAELGIPQRTVQDSRLKLVRNGWVFQFVYRNNVAKPTHVTVVGEKLTRVYKKNPSSISTTFERIFKETAAYVAE